MHLIWHCQSNHPAHLAWIGLLPCEKNYSISILYFDIGKGNNYLYYGLNQFTGIHAGDQLRVNVKDKNAIVTRMPADIFPEYILIRVNEFNQVAVPPLEEWMIYLKTGIIRPDTTALGLREAREKLKYYSVSSQECYAYDEHLSAVMTQNDVLESAKIEGMMEGRAEGIEKGREEGRLLMVRNMKSKGLDDVISLPVRKRLRHFDFCFIQHAERR